MGHESQRDERQVVEILRDEILRYGLGRTLDEIVRPQYPVIGVTTTTTTFDAVCHDKDVCLIPILEFAEKRSKFMESRNSLFDLFDRDTAALDFETRNGMWITLPRKKR